MAVPVAPSSAAPMVNADRTPTDVYFRLIVQLLVIIRELDARISALEP